NAAGIGESLFLAGADVGELDGQALVEESQLAQAGFQGVVVEGGPRIHDRRIGLESDFRAGAVAFGGAELLDLGGGIAAFIFLDVDLAVAIDAGLGPFGKGGDGLGADAVQAGRRLVGTLVELGAGAEGSEHDFERGPAHLGVNVHGNAATVVGHGQAAIDVDLDVDIPAEAAQGLINAVIDQLVDQVVQSLGAGIADVHAG